MANAATAAAAAAITAPTMTADYLDSNLHACVEIVKWAPGKTFRLDKIVETFGTDDVRTSRNTSLWLNLLRESYRPILGHALHCFASTHFDRLTPQDIAAVVEQIDVVFLGRSLSGDL